MIVSMAGEGAVLVTEDQAALQSAAPQGTLVNAVGAGDSMVAGFLAGWEEAADDLRTAEKTPCKHAFHMGLAAGSASAFSEYLATREEVLRVYETMVS